MKLLKLFLVVGFFTAFVTKGTAQTTEQNNKQNAASPSNTEARAGKAVKIPSGGTKRQLY